MSYGFDTNMNMYNMYNQPAMQNGNQAKADADSVGMNSAFDYLNPNAPTQKDFENIYKYGNGQALSEEKSGVFDGFEITAGFMGLLGVGKEGYQAFKHRADLRSYFATKKAEKLVEFNKFKVNGGIWKSKAYKGAINDYRAESIKMLIPEKAKLSKLSPEAKKLYAQAAEHAEAAKSGVKSGSHLNLATRYLYKAKVTARAVESKPTGFFGKIGHFFSKTLGLSKIIKGAEKLATKSPIVGKILKVGKSVKSWAILQGVIELGTQVIPTFVKLGFAKGCKQLLKSTVKTAASCLGWGAGEYVGAAGGAAIGAAIGSIVPGIGTAIGGAIGGLCGLVGGLVGAHYAEKAADAICGKNELEIAQEEEGKQKIGKAATDPNTLKEIATNTVQRLQQDDPKSPDAILAKQSLSKIANFEAAKGKSTNSQTNSTDDSSKQADNVEQQGQNAASDQQATVQPNTQFGSFGNLTNTAYNANNTNGYNQNNLGYFDQSQNFNNGFSYNMGQGNMNPMMLQAMYQQTYSQNPFGTAGDGMMFQPQFGTPNTNMNMMNMYNPYLMNQNLV